MNRTIPILLMGLILFLTVDSCDFREPTSPDPPPENVTRILEVKISPNPVQVDSTVRFTCIVEDSTDKSLKFFWDISHGSNTVTDSNKWVTTAPESTGTYEGRVEIFKEEVDKNDVWEGFRLEVIDTLQNKNQKGYGLSK